MPDLDTAWTRFEEAARAAGPIAALFEAEPDRLQHLTLEGAGLRLDLSKQPLSAAGLSAGLALAETAGLEAARAALFGGQIVNASEGRPALHMALRAADGADYRAAGKPVSGEVEAARAAMKAFAEGVRSGAITGATGKPFRAVAHIGIGGSDLGPRLVWEALKPLDSKMELRFVANVDGAEIAAALAGLDPRETLVIAVSKTFTTLETLANAQAARDWLEAAVGVEGAKTHFAAVSANVKAAGDFGVAAARVFPFWDWVGGRYSIWSAVGLSCAVGLGWGVFEGFLGGGRVLDEHFLRAPLGRNGPVLLALAHLANRNGLGRPVRAVVPYARRLTLLPAFLQQLEMESNGKRVSGAGKPLTRPTATAVFGDAGTNGQHAFFQLLHQGTDIIPVDIVAVAKSDEGPAGMHAKLLANAIAQGEALMNGRSEAEVRAELEAKGTPADQIDALAAQRTFPGNRPTSFILLPQITPQALGALIALYEHKVFVEGVLWGIDSFDQWGVELGKTLATKVLAELEGGPAGDHDPSTADLIARLKG
ncbi:MAG TPA: glucose-6-phosphate isomerase [Caulobacteraceae bacterium]